MAAAFALVVLTALAAGPAQADPFAQRAGAWTIHGDIALAGNSVLSCPSGAQGCAAARDGSGRVNDNDWQMADVDIDGDPATFDSSSATLDLPAGAAVRYAGLYWGGESTSASRGSVQLKVPGATGYRSVEADAVQTAAGTWYQGFADVTAIVQAGGRYTVADVQADLGYGRSAGWTLVVAYELASDPLRNLTVFDGLQKVSNGTVTLGPAGFTTPPAPAGPVVARVGMVIYEGDLGLLGDTASLAGTLLDDHGGTTGSTNIFDSSSTRDGVARTGRVPGDPNSFGYDQDVIATRGVLPNGATSASLALTSAGDDYVPGIVTFAIDVFEPSLGSSLAQTISPAGARVEPGETRVIGLTGINQGSDALVGATATSDLPTGLSLVPGSLEQLVAGAWQPVANAGTDRHLVAVIGDLAIGDGFALRLTVRVAVDPALADGTRLALAPVVRFRGATLGRSYELAADPLELAVAAPDLALVLGAPARAVRGTEATLSLALSNRSTAATVAGRDVVISADLRGLESVRVERAPGYACAVAGAVLSCRLPVLAGGASAAPIALAARIAQGAPDALVLHAAVTGGGARASADTEASVSVTVVSETNLTVHTGSPDAVSVGDHFEYVVRVVNDGPSDASGVTVTQQLPVSVVVTGVTAPPGSTFVCVVLAHAVSCTGDLAGGSSVELRVAAIAVTAGSLTSTTRVRGGSSEGISFGERETLISPLASLSVRTRTTAAAVDRSGHLGYRFTVANAGPSAAATVRLRGVFDPALTIERIEAPGFTCSRFDRSFVCRVPLLAADASEVVEVRVRVTGPVRTVPNAVRVLSATPDRLEDDDTSTVVTAVRA